MQRCIDGRWFESHFGKNFSVRNFGNSVYPALPVSFGWYTKSRWSLLSGVYARGSKRSHQSVLECVTVVDSTSHSKPPRSASMRLKKLPCTDKGRRRRLKEMVNTLYQRKTVWFQTRNVNNRPSLCIAAITREMQRKEQNIYTWSLWT